MVVIPGNNSDATTNTINKAG